MNIDNITNIKSIIIKKKITHTHTYLFNPVVFMLLTTKYSQKFPKHNGYFFNSKSFSLN